jgi:hypothetical protein
MWTYVLGANVKEEFYELAEIHGFSMDHEDFDAADACVDGMRDILQDWRDDLGHPFDPVDPVYHDFEAPDGRLIVNYMVHTSCDIPEWIEAFEEGNYLGEAGSLHDALAKKFAEEAQRRREEEVIEPDLMERCRYHLHVEKGLPCYLDK